MAALHRDADLRKMSMYAYIYPATCPSQLGFSSPITLQSAIKVVILLKRVSGVNDHNERITKFWSD